MLLRPAISFSAVDDDSFDVSIADGGRTVTGRVLLDERGAPRDFSTTDRFVDAPGRGAPRYVRTRWTTPVDGWDLSGERPMLTRAQTIWHMPDGTFPYADFRRVRESLELDVPGLPSQKDGQ